MPIYQYRCKNCNKIIEKLQKINDKPVKICTECGGKVEKIISAPGIIFKGGGFHVTDYAKSKSYSAPFESKKGEKKEIKKDTKDKKEK